jgi:hypothetical protein
MLSVSDRVARYHSAVLSDTGHLYTCGANGSGQLGLEHEKMMFSLTPVKALYAPTTFTHHVFVTL